MPNKADQAEQSVELRLIEPDDKLTGFSLGDPDFVPLKTFLKKHAQKYNKEMLARSYGVFAGKKIIAYISLVCGEIAPGEDETFSGGIDAEFSYSHYPSIKIARLAVHRNYRGSGAGRQLVDFALGTAKDRVSGFVGCRFVAVDAKQKSIPFYERLGFRMIDTPENRSRSEPIMFLDLMRV